MEVCLINVETFDTKGYELESAEYSFVLIGPKTSWDDEEIKRTIAKNSYSNGLCDFEYKVSEISRHEFATKHDFADWLQSLLRERPSIDVVDSEYGEAHSYTKMQYESVPIPWFAVQDFVQPFVL